MERRKFLTNLMSVAGISIVTPQIVKAIAKEETSEVPLTPVYNSPAYSKSWDNIKESLLISEDFFKYLKNNPPNFEWERVKDRIFQNEKGSICTCSARKLRTSWTDGPIWDDLTPVYGAIVEEIEQYNEKWGERMSHMTLKLRLKYYIRQLYLIPRTIGPLLNINNVALISHREIEY